MRKANDILRNLISSNLELIKDKIKCKKDIERSIYKLLNNLNHTFNT